MTEMTPKTFVFVLMPFADKFEDIYKLGIKAACQEAGAYCERVDEQIFQENILERIYNQISKADIVVSDVTDRNPNVFYETGYAHALGKHVILLTQHADDIPFDLKHYAHIVYDGKITRLKDELHRRVRWAIENPRTQFNQVDSYLKFFISGSELAEVGEPFFEINKDVKEPIELTFSLDVCNTSNLVIDASSIQLGLILPIKFESGVGLRSVHLPDGRCMHLLPKLERFLPNSWQPIAMKIEVTEIEALRGNSNQCTLRVFTEIGTRDFDFSFRIL